MLLLLSIPVFKSHYIIVYMEVIPDRLFIILASLKQQILIFLITKVSFRNDRLISTVPSMSVEKSALASLHEFRSITSLKTVLDANTVSALSSRAKDKGTPVGLPLVPVSPNIAFCDTTAVPGFDLVCPSCAEATLCRNTSKMLNSAVSPYL